MTEFEDGQTIPIGSVSHEDYWFIQIGGIEWTYILQKLIEKHLKDQPIAEKPIILGQTSDQQTIFMLRKKFLPAEALAAATGLSLDTVNTTPTLKLTVKPKDLPEATVPYWGTA